MSRQTLIDTIDNFCTKHNLLPPGIRVVLGLSGGPDSIFLLHYLAQKAEEGNLSLVAAHLDHQWRPDSAKDVSFCEQETSKLNIPLFIGRASELRLPLKFNGSKEELGRIMRRHFLEMVLAEQQADCIALAHQWEDQIETFFIRLLRGASVSGLRGMRPKYGLYIRPLLNTHRTDILAYLHEHKLPYLTDPSNESPEFLRNRIRNQLLPILHTIDSRFEQGIHRTIHHMTIVDDCLEQYTTEALQKTTTTYKDYQALNLSAFWQLHPYMQKRVLIAWFCANKVPFVASDRWLDEIIRFLTQPGSKTHRVHPNWAIVKKGDIIYCKKE